MITTVTYARLWNLGNYENERLEVTVAVEESDVTAAFITAIAAVESEHIRLLSERQRPAERLPVPASDKQRNYIGVLQDELGWTSEQLAAYAQEQRVDLVAMTTDQASRLINGMKRLISVHSGELPF